MVGKEPTIQLPLVLIVEDDENLLGGIIDILTMDGFCRVMGARHGKEAMQFMIQEAPALIISDIIMPFMDGLELLTRVRADPQFGHIPFLILSARNQQRDINTGIALGANDYIVKPFTPQGLIDKVSGVLTNR